MALRNAFANLATEPKQDTANTHLATIAGQTPLTNTQLRATALPISGTVSVSGNVAVTGTFFQTTQPVSGTVSVTGVATETTLAALNTKVPSLGQALMAASQPVTIASNQSALAVTGTFFQATQPVSGTVTVGNASIAVTGTFFQATQPVSGPLTNTELRATAVPVSGTFFQATQPVSIAGSVAVTGTFFQATQPVSLAAALPAGANTIGTTMGPTLTKATQGTTGYSVQNLKDAGRVLFSAATVIAGVTAVTAEALLTMVPTRDGVAAATTTSQAVTSGKRLRITGINVGFISTAAAVLSMRFALRMNPAGAVTATSPILRILSVPSGAALAQAGGTMDIEIPDGIEFSGTQQFGITQIGSAATGTVWVSLLGFEY